VYSIVISRVLELDMVRAFALSSFIGCGDRDVRPA